jgi:type VI protein secretion system component VasK
MLSIHMVSNLKTAADVGLFVLFISLLLAALPGLGFDNVRTGFALLGAALLCGLILIWTQILNEFFPGYKSMHRLIFTGVLLAVLIVLGIVGRAHAAHATKRNFGQQAIFVQPS